MRHGDKIGKKVTISGVWFLPNSFCDVESGYVANPNNPGNLLGMT